MLDITKVSDIIEEILPKGSSEYETIVQAYSELLRNLPTTSAQAHSKVSVLDTLRPQLSAIIFMLNNRWYKLSMEHSFTYNKDYTRWCNSGTKPSHAAIEAQIYRDNVDLMKLKYKLDDLDNLLEFVKSLVSSLDTTRKSVIEAWHDSNRFS